MNDHYVSQIILGWYLAYKSTVSVVETNRKFDEKDKVAYLPYLNGDAIGITVYFLSLSKKRTVIN